MIANQNSSMNPQHLTDRVGVLLYDSSVEVDRIFAEAVGLLQALDVQVGGVLQFFGERLANGKRSMWVEDIGSGTLIRLDHPRGPGAVACMLDPDALARTACMLQAALERKPQLVVVSRFGNAEADGRGLRTELAEAICSGAPVLVAVKFSLLNDLEGFLGCAAHLLLPSVPAIVGWAENIVAKTASLSAAVSAV